ncbi:MAG: glycosyltransferase [Candidatus Anammoxibacter sp.]
MKVALIHDWLTGMRGGEKCLEVLCDLYPNADIFTLLHNKGTVSNLIEEKNIKTSFVQKLPFLKKYRHFLPLFPTAIESFNLNGYDLVISVNHCVAKGVITNPETMHICYCLTPMRYVWDMYYSYFDENSPGYIGRKVIPFFANYLRMWDVTSSRRVEHFVAISHFVAKRILKYYGRKSEVVYPPVDCSAFKISDNVEEYYLMVTAFAPYKRVDLAIQAFNRLRLPLIIIGSGQDEKRLKELSAGNVEFLGWQSDEKVSEYYSKCKALIFPGEEDFGIVPLEAQASGRPVIAYGKGGVCETIIAANPQNNTRQVSHLEANGRQAEMHDDPENDRGNATGIFFYEQTVDAIVDAVKEFEKIAQSFDSQNIRNHALKFDKPIFKERIKNCIDGMYAKSKT